MPMVTTDWNKPSMLRSVMKLGTKVDTAAKGDDEDDDQALLTQRERSGKANTMALLIRLASCPVRQGRG